MQPVPRQLTGWRPQRPDHRDHSYFEQAQKMRSIPKVADLRAHCPRVEDQGDLGSCTAHATTSAMEYLLRKAGHAQPELSRLFTYYATRVWVEGTAPDDDSGCYNRDVMKAMAKYGTCPEAIWPYNVARFSRAPSVQAKRYAAQRKVTRYLAVTGLAAMRQCLAEGYPIVIGFSVPENMMSFECAQDGVVKMPGTFESMVGGHAVLCVGYDDKSGRLTFQNSWGSSWGDKGYGYLPYAFVTSGLANDFWTIRAEELALPTPV